MSWSKRLVTDLVIKVTRRLTLVVLAAIVAVLVTADNKAVANQEVV